MESVSLCSIKESGDNVTKNPSLSSLRNREPLSMAQGTSLPQQLVSLAAGSGSDALTCTSIKNKGKSRSARRLIDRCPAETPWLEKRRHAAGTNASRFYKCPQLLRCDFESR